MTKEQVYREILGKVNWRTMEELPISCITRATEMLSLPEGPMVLEAYETLLRFGWFVVAKMVDTPPWELKEEHWLALCNASPWPDKTAFEWHWNGCQR